MTIFTRLRILAVLSGALLLGPAGTVQAAQTSIAQVPLLNMTGTGTVKPNLMLLFDNSGSMDWHFLPDSVGNGSTYQCRGQATLRDAVSSNTLCSPGHPPFMSNDFNKIYYNPATRYQAPIKFDGSHYPDMTSSATTAWTVVPMDGFSSRAAELDGVTNSSTTATSNLVTGFPDLKWCNSAGTCKTNTATYTYPDATYTTSRTISTNPYYYNIGVAQYCADANLTNCVPTSVGAPAPAGYPYPVKVRWCENVNLSNCQAKQVGKFKFPSFSTPLGSTVAYGTISIGQSASTKSMTINSVSIPTSSTKITTGVLTASTGTDTPLKQQTVASQLASSIMTTNLTNQYWACVRTPIGTTNVSPCSTYGITLAADNIVAVIPIDCIKASDKSVTNCVPSTDASSAGLGIVYDTPSVLVTPAVPAVQAVAGVPEVQAVAYVPAVQAVAAVAAVPSTALITISGTTVNSGTPTITSITWNGVTLGSNITPGKNKTGSSLVAGIVNDITASTDYTIVAGGNSITPTCQNASASSLCLVAKTATSNPTGAITISALSGLSYTFTAGAGYKPAVAAVAYVPPVAAVAYKAAIPAIPYQPAIPAVYDQIPVATAAISAGTNPASTFQRVDIVSTRTTYPRATGRTDCVATAGSCSYAEEMTNFANWYAYYKSRIQMTKSAVGLAFAPVTGNYRVGLSKMSSSGAAKAIELKPDDFTGTARQNWYSTFYATTTSGSTPTRPALDNVGRMYANLSPYAYAAGSEVIQYPCQQNFILLTTDGYWNQGYSGSAVSNDNAESAARFCTAGRACVDPRPQSAASLADVALYWYNGGSNTSTVSLRPSIDDITKPGLVTAGPGENTHLHVTTFTMGLGIDGVMNYEGNYDTAPQVGGDFYNLLTGATTGCPWNSNGAYVWPDPNVTDTTSNTVQERVDDLWHAAINGHGKYYSASDPASVQKGLSEAISTISIRVGAASAAATSTPNISQQDNDIFADIFTTGKWYGELSDKKIDINTGIVGQTALWTTTDRLGLTVAASTDTRTIKMLDTTTGGLKDFTYASMSATEQGWFDNKCSLLPQCALLSAADRITVNAGTNIVTWLRGQQQFADDTILRAYTKTTPTAGTPIPIVLGDIASSKPAFMRGPTRSYSTAGYSTYKTDQANRAPTVFTAANDGMLHAFSATTGDELWAYAPRITMQKLYKLTSTNYSANHQFSTDGSPELGDVQIGTTWKTVLVAGLNGGGRGYYALDVTDPTNPPVPLWELCADSAVCAKNDPDIGLTFGNPQFGQWQGKWVVFLTSGYNNVSGVDGVTAGTTGQGFLYIVDVSNGTVLKKISTGNGSVATPSGFAKITSISSNPFTDPVTTFIYGGDNTGQMWRFDLTDPTPGVVTVVKMGDAGTGQPITTRPEITQCLEIDTVNSVKSSRAQRLVMFGTGRLLDISDTNDNSMQSLYALKDNGTTIANIRGTAMVKQTLSLLGSSTNTNTYTITANPVDLSVNDGWYMDWNLNSGERMNLDPQVVSGGLNVVTTLPTSSSSCSVGGSSNVYQLGVCTGTAVSVVGGNRVAGGTLSNTSAAVGFIIVRLPSGSIKMITTTASGSTITTNVTAPNSQSARKVGWRTVNGE